MTPFDEQHRTGIVLPPEVQQLAQILTARTLRLATAESCTGGLIAHWMTCLAGCSAFYNGGVVAYANAAKSTLLGVSSDDLVRHGAVSATVAEAMASGVLDRLQADVALSTTGIAGPEGGSPAKPVGQVYIGVAMRENVCRVKVFHFEGSRSDVQIAAGQQALKMVLKSFGDKS